MKSLIEIVKIFEFFYFVCIKISVYFNVFINKDKLFFFKIVWFNFNFFVGGKFNGGCVGRIFSYDDYF